MIGKERIELNNRFKQVFKLLEERGQIELNCRKGKGMGDFAFNVTGNRSYGHLIRAFLDDNDKRCILHKYAKRICQVYGIDEGWFLLGKGSEQGSDDFAIPTLQKIEKEKQLRTSINLIKERVAETLNHLAALESELTEFCRV